MNFDIEHFENALLKESLFLRINDTYGIGFNNFSLHRFDFISVMRYWGSLLKFYNILVIKVRECFHVSKKLLSVKIVVMQINHSNNAKFQKL